MEQQSRRFSVWSRSMSTAEEVEDGSKGIRLGGRISLLGLGGMFRTYPRHIEDVLVKLSEGLMQI